MIVIDKAALISDLKIERLKRSRDKTTKLVPADQFSDVDQPGYFRVPEKGKRWAIGSEYGPLLTDGTEYLCPDCGGWGHVNGTALVPGDKCEYCEGFGTLPLNDARIVDYNDYKPTFAI